MTKEADAFRTISEVAEILGIPQHVLRFWELKFPQINPLKRAGGRRYYRPGEVALLGSIRDLLYADGYTIKGVQRLLREQGVRAVSGMAARLKMPADQLRSGSSPDAAHDVDPEIHSSIGKLNEGQLGTRIDALAAEIDECAAMLSAAAVAAEQASSFNALLCRDAAEIHFATRQQNQGDEQGEAT